jgi:hypothetical protein
LAALLGAEPILLFWLGGRKVANPGLGGGQVAVPHLHVASSFHVMNAPYAFGGVSASPK